MELKKYYQSGNSVQREKTYFNLKGIGPIDFQVGENKVGQNMKKWRICEFNVCIICAGKDRTGKNISSKNQQMLTTYIFFFKLCRRAPVN